MSGNKFNIADARRADPLFTARAAAADALRDGIYDRLEARGVKAPNGESVRELRQYEGSLIQLRNRLQDQVYIAEKTVSATKRDTLPRRIAAGLTATTGATVAKWRLGRACRRMSARGPVSRWAARWGRSFSARR